MADAPLSEAGEAQLLEVARSLQRRRLRAVAEVVSEFKEAKEDRLTEELYTHEDAERLLDGLLGLVRTSVKNDVRASEHSTLLLLNDALAQAARRRRRRRRPGALRRPRAAAGGRPVGDARRRAAAAPTDGGEEGRRRRAVAAARRPPAARPCTRA